MRFPLILRAWHDADVARLVAERDQLAKDLAAAEAELAGVSEKYTDTAIVNNCLTEDLVKIREQLAASQQVEGALARQIHEMAQPVDPDDAYLDDITRLTNERDSEKKRADHLQRQLDDALGLKASGIEDSSRWQPGYKAPEVAS
jgi:chromosome segregation ATPase